MKLETKLISIKGRKAKAFPNTVKAIVEAVKEGYELPPEDSEEWNCRMIGDNYFMVSLIKEGEVSTVEIPLQLEEDDQEPSIEEIVKVELTEEELAALAEWKVELGKLSKKKELLSFAKEIGLEVPEDLKYPAQIKVFIERELEKV